MIASKIRIYPSPQQKSLLWRWFGVSRKTYNATVEYLKTPETNANFYAIKKWLIPSLPDSTQEVPRSIRDDAVEEACKAAKPKYRQTGEMQRVDFRSRRDPA
jgi:putative transposase